KGDPAAGAAIYKQKCTSCHAIDRAVVGPALKGMSERHDEQWLIKWIRNSQALVASGDPAAVKVFEEYNKVVMTPFPELTDDDIVNIIAYVQTEGDKPAAPAGGAAAGAEGAVSGDSGEVSNFMLGGLILVVLITLLVILVLNRVIKTLDRVILQKKGIAVEEDGVVSTKETAYEKI